MKTLLAILMGGLFVLPGCTWLEEKKDVANQQYDRGREVVEGTTELSLPKTPFFLFPKP